MIWFILSLCYRRHFPIRNLRSCRFHESIALRLNLIRWDLLNFRGFRNLQYFRDFRGCRDFRNPFRLLQITNLTVLLRVVLVEHLITTMCSVEGYQYCSTFIRFFFKLSTYSRSTVSTCSLPNLHDQLAVIDVEIGQFIAARVIDVHSLLCMVPMRCLWVKVQYDKAGSYCCHQMLYRSGCRSGHCL